MERPVQVVIDTNVFIAALRSKRGAAYQVMASLQNPVWQNNISVPLLLEYEEIARREKAALQLNGEEIEKSLKVAAAFSNHRITHFKWPVTKDAEDEMVIELAINSRCKYIITFNTRNFVRAKEFGIQVVTPGEFLQLARRL